MSRREPRGRMAPIIGWSGFLIPLGLLGWWFLRLKLPNNYYLPDWFQVICGLSLVGWAVCVLLLYIVLITVFYRLVEKTDRWD